MTERGYPAFKQSMLVFLLLAVLFLLNWFSVQNKSLTYNEIDHYAYGAMILHGYSDRGLDDSKMPISTLNALPVLLKTIGIEKRTSAQAAAASREQLAILPAGSFATWQFQPGVENRENIHLARLPTVLFSLLLGFYVFRWTNALYGYRAGIFALFLYVFSPNIIAHSRLATTDLYSTCLIVISTYYFWRFVNAPSWRMGALSATVLGVSQLTKYTCVYLYPIFLLILLVRHLWPSPEAERPGKPLGRTTVTFAKFAVLFSVINLLVINAGFLFNGTFQPLSKYRFQSDAFSSLQAVPVVRDVPLPVPVPFLEGLDRCRFREHTGEGYGLNYMFGRLRNRGEAFIGYYFVAFLLKVPLATQLLLLSSMVAWFLRKGRAGTFMNDGLFLAVPVLFFTLYFNFFFKAQMGIRHFIVVIPFLCIFMGSLVITPGAGPKAKACIYALCCYLVVSVASYFPHYISYFNELVWDRRMAYKYLVDSCLDLGQNERYLRDYKWNLRDYKRKDPSIHIRPQSPVEGTVVVSANWLTGVLPGGAFAPEGQPDYAWLRDNFDPVDHIAYSFLVFEVPVGSLKRLNIKQSGSD